MASALTRAGTRQVRRERAARRDAVVQEIREAVDRLAHEGQSFSELSVDRIAAAAGISRSTFYRYFKDKSELLMALAEELIRERNVAGFGIWDVPPTAPRTAIDAAFDHFLRVCWRHRVVTRAVADAQAYDPAAREMHRGVYRTAIDVVDGHIRAGQAGGWVRDDIAPRRTAQWLVAMNDRGLATLVDVDEDALDALARSLAAIVWFSLYDGARDPAGTTPER